MKILIYIGHPEIDKPGLCLGRELAEGLNAELTLLNVVNKGGDKQKKLEEREKLLEEAKKILGDFPAKTKTKRGKIAKKILEEVEKGRYDMVVATASRIRGYPLRFSVDKEIFPSMPCCVVIANTPQEKIGRILVCTGGLQVADAVVNVSAKIAGALGAEVTIMHVIANVPSMFTGLETIEETLGELLQTDTPVAKHLRNAAEVFAEHEVPSELKLRHGEAVYEIVREIDMEDYDMVVIGASGANTSLKEWFMGNITKEIIDLVNIPILVVNQTHAQRIYKSIVD